MSRKIRRGTLLAATLALTTASLLAGCGSDARKTEGTRRVTTEVKGIIGKVLGRGKSEAPAPPDAETMALSALKNNSVPLVLVVFENTKATTILGMTGENGTMRTYTSPAQQALILRSGMLAGTRGFGFDVMSGEVADLGALVRARQAGEADYILRYLDGLGHERPLPMRCSVKPGTEPTGYEFAGQSWSGTPVGVHCEGSGAVVDDSFIVAQDGAIIASRQWVGPEIGYIAVQTVRP